MCPNVIYEVANNVEGAARRLRMYYSGGDQSEPDSIGVAFSHDGRTWNKASQNPIFTSDPSAWWEQAKVTAAHVFYDCIDAMYYMFYIGFADIDTASVNVARSKDGLTHWHRHPANPIIAREARNTTSWMRDAVYKPYALYDASRDEWLLWFNGRCGEMEQIGVAVKKGHDLGFDNGTRSCTAASASANAEAE